MSSNRLRPLAGLGLLLGSIAWSWLLAAPASRLLDYLVHPAYLALVGATLTAPAYAVLTNLKPRRRDLERLLLASFLAGMPIVYLWSALRAHDLDGVYLELGGTLLYGTCAVLGYRRSTLLLGFGIAAHGIAWDAWHHGHAAYMEPWYPLLCLIVDVAFFLAIAANEYPVAAIRSPAARGAHD